MTQAMKDPLYHYTIIRADKEPMQDDAPRMPFLPDELREQLIAARASEDPVVLAHYFLAGGSFDWYIFAGESASKAIAARPDDFLFYGWIIDTRYPQNAELGEVLLSQLLDLHSFPFGLPVEREWIWEPTPLSEVKAKGSSLYSALGSNPQG